jgi:tetratricopeptide (TPR) repeat protein
LINRGDAWRAKGRIDLAEADYGQAARLDPDNALAYINRAVAYKTQWQYELAIVDYDQVIRLEPANAAGWSGRCWSRAIVGQLDQALADCNEALRLESLANALEARALVYLKLGQLDQAIADYDAALKSNSTLAGPLYGRGVAKLRKGQVADANADTAAAMEINPKISDSFAAYNVRTVGAEVALPAVEAPVAMSSTRPEPIAPAAEVPASQAAQAEPAAPPPAVEITTSVTRPPQSGTVKSTSLASFPVPPATVVAPPPAADCSWAETHWKSAESIGTLAAYNDHLARFPNCVFSTLAAARIEALKK